MTPDEFLQACAKLGIACDSPQECLRQAGVVLRSRAEHPKRKEAVCELLRLFEPCASGETQKAAQYLLQDYCTEPDQRLLDKVPPSCENLPLKPQSPSWRKWIDEPGTQRNWSERRYFGDVFCNRMKSAMGGLPMANQDALLLEVVATLNLILGRLSDALSHDALSHLEAWVKQAKQAARRKEVEAWLDTLQAALDKADWEALGKGLARAGEFGELAEPQAGRLEGLRQEHARWRNWQAVFADVLKKLQDFQPTAADWLPWPYPLEPMRQREAVDGLARWGAARQRDELETSLRRLADAVSPLLQDFAEADPLGRAAKVKAVWGKAVSGAGLPAPDWVAIEAALWAEADQRFQTWHDAIVVKYAGGPLGGHPACCVSETAAVRYQPRFAAVEKEARRLMALDKCLREQWAPQAQPALLQDAAFKALPEELEALGQVWVKSPMFQNIGQAFAALKTDIEHWAQAEEALRHGGIDPQHWDAKQAYDQGLPSGANIVACLQEALVLLRPVQAQAALAARERFAQWLDDASQIERLLLSPEPEPPRPDASAVVQHFWGRIEADKTFKAEYGGYVERAQRETAQLRDIWERIEADKTSSKAYSGHQEFAQVLTARDREFREHEQRYEALAQEAMERLREGEKRKAWRSDDSEELKALKNRLLDTALGQADLQIKALQLECRPYPLQTESALDGFADRCASLRKGLQQEELVRYGERDFLPKLVPIETIIEVQRLLRQRDWAAAEALLGERGGGLDKPIRDGLQAALEDERLGAENAPDERWLALYLRHPVALLSDRGEPGRYLARLRRALPPAEASAAHARVLEYHCQARAEWLRGLLWLLAGETAQALPLLRQSQPEDEDLAPLGRVLGWFAEEQPVPRPLLEALWLPLHAEHQAKAWPRQPNPLETHKQRFDAGAKQVEARLDDPAHPPHALLEALRQLEKTYGYPVGRNLTETLESLETVARRLADFERGDPWSLEQEAVLRHTLARCEVSLIATACEKRGWTQAVRKRLRGIDAWKKLWMDWQEFRRDFYRLPLPGVYNSEGWGGFAETLGRWGRRLADAAGRIDFNLANADKSRNWADFLQEWQGCAERGLAERRGLAPPARLADLDALYREALADLNAFAELHARLARLPPCDNPDVRQQPENERALAELHGWQPLTHPVEEMRRRLADPLAGGIVGIQYRAWLARQENTHRT